MAHYYFQIEGGAVLPDGVGSDHDTLDAARVQAVRSLAEIIDEKRETFWNDQPVRVVVFGADRQRLFTLEARACRD